MQINRLELENFRNYAAASAEFSPEVNLISGENAQGKTNLLEAVYYFSCARSFRARADRELVRFGETSASLKADFFSGGRGQTAEIALSGGRKRISVNSVRLKTASALSGRFCCVLFSPDDLELVRGGAALRRRFMDLAICQLRPRYAASLARFNKYCEHKLRILRDWRSKPSLLEVLDDFNHNLAHVGAQLIYYRAAWCRRLADEAETLHRDISGTGEALNIGYKTVKTVENPEKMRPEEIFEALMQHQESHRQAELEAGALLSGAMKDDIEISINSAPARGFASQGQARTAALSLKLAEREIIRSVIDEYPVLLLDDVLSELDERRQDFVLNRISGGQVMISCCDARQAAAKTGGAVFKIEHGTIEKEK